MRKQWEYKWIGTNRSRESEVWKLNELGAEGWELVRAGEACQTDTHSGMWQFEFIFKREVLQRLPDGKTDASEIGVVAV